MATRHRSLRIQRSRGKRSRPLFLECLEARLVLSVRPNLNFMEFHDPSRIPAGETPSPMGILPLDGGLPFPIGYAPGDIQTAYGIDQIKFGSVTGDGTGQTIAIVDAYDDPAFVNSTDSKFATATSPSSISSSGLPIHPASPRSTSPGKPARCPAPTRPAPGMSTATGKSKRPSISNGRMASRRGPTSFSSRRRRIATPTCSARSPRPRVFPASPRSP